MWCTCELTRLQPRHRPGSTWLETDPVYALGLIGYRICHILDIVINVIRCLRANRAVHYSRWTTLHNLM
jgi:hypothetical protein